jgi:hypothetical protein
MSDPVQNMSIRDESPGGRETNCVHSGHKILPSTGFAYPDEIETLLDNAEIRAALDEFVASHALKTIAEILNRLLTDIIDARDPHGAAVIAAWALGMKRPGMETADEIAKRVNLSRREIYNRRTAVLTALRD